MSDLVLVVSERCNLRCKYCAFSSFYESDGYRNHASSNMAAVTAIKALQWFLKYNDEPYFQVYPDRVLGVVFYGGEPLLNFKVIASAIEFAERAKDAHYDVRYSITSNLTLLSDAHIRFLKDHDVFLNVSLDGPQYEHDKFRRSRNGAGTHKRVMANLRRIRDFDERFYFEKVRLLPTITGATDLRAMFKFLPKITRQSFPLCNS